MVDGTASGQIPNIVIQPQIPPSTPLEHPAQQTIYVPTSKPYPTQTWQQKLKIKTYDGRCVDFSRSNQRSIQTSHCHDGTNQHFIFHPDQSITVQGKCLDIYNGKMKMYSCNQNRGQKFSCIAL